MESGDMIECTVYIMRPSLQARCIEVNGKVYAHGTDGVYTPITFMASSTWLSIVNAYIDAGNTPWDKVKTSIPANRIVLSP